MTVGTTTADVDHPVLDLISPFSESQDARLRSNAVHALVALARADDSNLREQAKQQLVRLLAAEPSGGADWQRRFSSRALDALRRLPAGEHDPICMELSKQLRNADPTQRGAVARLLLAGSEPCYALWRLGWVDVMRLAHFVGRPGFWLSMWSALWRTALVLTVLMLAASLQPWVSLGRGFGEGMPQLFVVGLWIMFILGLTARFSLTGRLEPPIGVRFIDASIGVALFVTLAIIGVVQLVDPRRLYGLLEFDVDQLLQVGVVAFAVGAVVRLLRWAGTSVRLEPDGTSQVLRPLAAFLTTTIVCVAVARIGMDVRTASAMWLVLAPGAAVAVSLDLWLEHREPQPLLAREPYAQYGWLVPVVTGLALAVVVGSLVHSFYVLDRRTSREGSPNPQPEIRLPAGLPPDGSITIETRFGMRVALDVQEARVYTIVAKRRSGGGPALLIFTADNRLFKNADDRDARTFQDTLPVGHYYACVMPAPANDCEYLPGSEGTRFDELLDIGRFVMNFPFAEVSDSLLSISAR